MDLIKAKILITQGGGVILQIEAIEEYDCITWITPRKMLTKIQETQAYILKMYAEGNDELHAYNKLAEKKYKQLQGQIKNKLPAIKAISEDLSAIHKSLRRMKGILKLDST